MPIDPASCEGTEGIRVQLRGNTVVLPLRVTLDQHASHPVDARIVLLIPRLNLGADQPTVARLGQDPPSCRIGSDSNTPERIALVPPFQEIVPLVVQGGHILPSIKRIGHRGFLPIH